MKIGYEAYSSVPLQSTVGRVWRASSTCTAVDASYQSDLLVTQFQLLRGRSIGCWLQKELTQAMPSRGGVMMRCTSCGEYNPSQALFCSSCGEALDTATEPYGDVGVFMAYGHGWRQLWKHFLFLLLTSIVFGLISAPSSVMNAIGQQTGSHALPCHGPQNAIHRGNSGKLAHD